jgi:FMN reductase
MKKIAGISGNFARPSKTRTLVETILGEVASRTGGKAQLFDLADVTPALGAASYRTDKVPELDAAWSAIEGCGVLVVGSPTYKASYGGLLKHLFDLLDMKALKGRPILMCATGKALSHGPKVEQQFRLLFEFFEARPTAVFVYATDEDFTPEGKPTDALLGRIHSLVASLESA